MRALLAILALALAPAAHAQSGNCLDPTQSWTVPYSAGSIQAITYYLDTLVFAAADRSGSAKLYNLVPVNVAQTFTGLSNADKQFNARIKGQYYQILLAENLCPLLAETGSYLLSESK